MLQLTLLLILCATSSFALPTESGSRVIDGNRASKGQFPWQAAINIYTTSGKSFCGGSLISSSWVLTAAHCTQNAETIVVFLGIVDVSDTSGLVTVYADKIVNHPNYNPNAFINDVALIHLYKSVTFDDYIKPISLSSSSIQAGTKVLVSGFGLTSDDSNKISDYLNWVNLETISERECAIDSGSLVMITGGIICARGAATQNSCNGDSGGPLMTMIDNQAVVVGIVSFRYTQSCSSGAASAYTKIAPYVKWIQSQTGQL